MDKRNRKLLFSVTKKDLKIEWFSGTGAGGQYRNKHQNCIRIRHAESGAMVTGQSNRNRESNIKEAFNNLLANPKFKVWHAKKVKETLEGVTLEQKVETMMAEENIQIEFKDENGNWKIDTKHGI